MVTSRPAATSCGRGCSAQRRRYPETDVAGRANVQRHLAPAQSLHQGGIFQTTHPVQDAGRAQGLQRAPDALRAYRLAGVGQTRQPGRPRRVERRLEKLRRIVHLWPAQAQPHDPLVLVGGRPLGQFQAQLYRPLHARNIRRQPHLDPQFVLCPISRAVDSRQLLVKRDVFPVRVRGKDHFTIADVLLRLPLQELARNELHIGRGADAVTDHPIDVDEMIEIGKMVPTPQAGRRIVGQLNPVALRQRQQRRRTDRAFQVNVQLYLGHLPDKGF